MVNIIITARWSSTTSAHQKRNVGRITIRRHENRNITLKKIVYLNKKSQSFINSVQLNFTYLDGTVLKFSINIFSPRNLASLKAAPIYAKAPNHKSNSADILTFKNKTLYVIKLFNFTFNYIKVSAYFRLPTF